MRKVTAICLHENYHKIKNFTVVLSNGDTVPLIHYKDLSLAYNYNDFQDLYHDLLSILKQNNFYVAKCKQFGASFYSINFIDITKPNMPKKFGYRNG